MPGELGNPEEQMGSGFFERSHPTTGLYNDDPFQNEKTWLKGPYGERVLKVIQGYKNKGEEKPNG